MHMNIFNSTLLCIVTSACACVLAHTFVLHFLAYSQLFGAEQNCSEDASSPTKYVCCVVELCYNNWLLGGYWVINQVFQ